MFRLTYEAEQNYSWFDTKLGNFVVAADAIDAGKRAAERGEGPLVVQKWLSRNDFKTLYTITPREVTRYEAEVTFSG